VPTIAFVEGESFVLLKIAEHDQVRVGILLSGAHPLFREATSPPASATPLHRLPAPAAWISMRAEKRE